MGESFGRGPRPESLSKETESIIGLALGRIEQALAEGITDWHDPRIEANLGIVRGGQEQLRLLRSPGSEPSLLEKRVSDVVAKLEKANAPVVEK